MATELNAMETAVRNADVIKTVITKVGHPKLAMGLAFLGTLGLFGAVCFASHEIKARRGNTVVIEEMTEAEATADPDITIEINKEDITEVADK